MSKENNEQYEQESEEAISDTGKDIKREIQRYQAKMKLEEAPPPAGDSTRSEE
jgi:hypothetical protein